MIRIHETDDAVICNVQSDKTTAYGDLVLENSKFGSIGAQVQPQLLTLMGGEVLAELDGELVRGTADQIANGKASRFVAYENELPSMGRFGLCLIILHNSASPRRDGPWFS